jgi:Tfp pilus assembly protein PilX
LRSERGSALILAVIAMLVMGVLSVSFALLADMETRIGVNYKQQAQAEALAEAALERGRDAVRTAPTAAGGFTGWLNGTAAGMAGAHLFAWNGAGLGAGSYSARLDNDCALANTIPAAVEEPAIGGTPCGNDTDTNETAVLTAWATAGTGASRIRAVVAVDNPWKHVCSNAKPDNNGYCNEPGNRNGNPTIQPADPNDPNGPAAYNALPLPVIGCSRVAPGLHRGAHALAVQVAGCQANPNMYTPPGPTGIGNPPRFAVMGELPVALGGTMPAAKTCNNEPIGGNGNVYFGYFDCALTTYCLAADGHVCGTMGDRKGCLRGPLHAAIYGGLPDTRMVVGHPNYDNTRYTEYDPITGTCVGGSTGTVITGNVNFNQDVGAPAKQFDVYVHNGSWSQGNNRKFYGTLVVETNGAGGTQLLVGNGNATELWAGKNGLAATAAWPAPHTYGYPLVALVYDPNLAAPTVSPYAPQNHTADFGSNNTNIHGIIYSGGHVLFNPLAFDGGVVAFEIQTQGSATYTYNGTYGNATPPPGFMAGTGNQVVIIRKSFIVCVNYAADTGGIPSTCN